MVHDDGMAQTIIHYRRIEQAFESCEIAYFAGSDDLGLCAREEADAFYECQRYTLRHFTEQNLVEIVRPQPENSHYYVEIYPTDFLQTVYPFARLRCDWDVARNEPIFATGIHAFMTDKKFNPIGALTFNYFKSIWDSFLRQFPDEDITTIINNSFIDHFVTKAELQLNEPVLRSAVVANMRSRVEHLKARIPDERWERLEDDIMLSVISRNMRGTQLIRA